MARRYNPFACCPICGADVGRRISEHRCSKASLAAIDAVHKRFENAEDREDDYSGSWRERPVGERLAAGFEIMGRAYDEDED